MTKAEEVIKQITKTSQGNHNILVFPIWLYLATVVLCVIIAVVTAKLLPSYSITTDVIELLQKINNSNEIILYTEIDQK